MIDSEYNRECCGECEYHVHEPIDDGWVCTNPDSLNCAEWTAYDDSCAEFSQKRD